MPLGHVTVKLSKWNGGKILGEARTSAARALNATAADAVAIAQAAAPRDTGFMANTIEIVEPATAKGFLRVTWGNVTAPYTIWQEIGSQGRPGRYFLRKGTEAYANFKTHFMKIGGA